MNAPVSAVLLTRDDAGLDAAIASVRPHVAEVIVVDTSPDQVPRWEERGPGYVVVYFSACNDDEGRIADFAAARNYAFLRATQPWLLTLDADDVALGLERLPEVLAAAERTACPRIFVRYEYAYDADGDCTLLQWTPRIVRRGTHEWTGRVHEVLVARPGHTSEDSRTEALVWKHRRQYLPTREHDAGRNLRILESTVADGEMSPRLHFHLGCEYDLLAQVNPHNEDVRIRYDAKASAHLRACIDGSALPAERALAMLRLAGVELRSALMRTTAHGRPFETERVEAWLLEALKHDPDLATVYFELAKTAYIAATGDHLEGWAHPPSAAERARLFGRVVRWGELGLAMPTPTADHDPTVAAYHAHTWLAGAYAALGQEEASRTHIDLALRAKPNAPAMRHLRDQWGARDALARIRADLAVLRRAGVIDLAVEEIATQAITDPKALKGEIRTFREHHPSANPPSGAGLRIVFACGASAVPFNPDILRDEGLGGSETAVIEMAKRLAARGHHVRVYGNVGTEMVRDGVEYLRAGKMFASPPCDVLIAWRNAALLEPDAGPVHVRARIVWAHDTAIAEMTPDRALLADRVLALSAWHREHLLASYSLHPSQVVQTRNGIDLARFEVTLRARRADDPPGPGNYLVEPPRNPHKVIYSSSPDRGLEVLLDLWPQVRREVPDAELHAFYGFDTWALLAKHRRDRAALEEIGAIKAKAAALADQGVTLHGKVDPATLARAMLSAGVWAHPSWTRSGAFYETSCIGAMEAQAAGCMPVAGRWGALPETIGGGPAWALVDGPLSDPGAREAFARYLVNAMAPGTEREMIVHSAQARFAWDGVVDHWLDVFGELLASEGDLVPFTEEGPFGSQEAAQ